MPEVGNLIRAHRITPALLLGAILFIGLAVALIDRPAATWAHAAFHANRSTFDALTHLVDPLLPASSLGLVGVAAAMAAGYRPARVGQLLVTCCLAVILTVTLKDQAKYAFGRLWPETWIENNPSWIGNGAYGFYPFHGGRGWASFPSGHTAVMSAPAAVLWRSMPRLRWVAALLVLLVAVGLFGADYHFISDMLAGILLGSAVGLLTVELVALNWRVAGTAKVGDGAATEPPVARTRPAWMPRPTTNADESAGPFGD